MAHRSRWFTMVYLLKMGGSFHGELLVITRGYLGGYSHPIVSMDLKGHFTGNHGVFTIKYMGFFPVKFFPVKQSIDSTNYKLGAEFSHRNSMAPRESSQNIGDPSFVRFGGSGEGSGEGTMEFIPKNQWEVGWSYIFSFPKHMIEISW